MGPATVAGCALSRESNRSNVVRPEARAPLASARVLGRARLDRIGPPHQQDSSRRKFPVKAIALLATNSRVADAG